MDIEEQYDKIYHYCYFKLYDKQLAQDITQETFLRFFRQDLSLDSNKELPYLYTIAKNLCVDNFRKKTAVILEDVTEEATYNPTEDLINHLTLKSIISKLSQEEQELIFLRYVNEMGVTARFLKTLPQPQINMWEFILTQAAYLRKWTLFLSVLLLFPALIGAYYIEKNTLWVVSAFIPCSKQGFIFLFHIC